MDIINDYEQEKTCAYKDELYIVRDNGAVKRLTPEGKKPRKLDNVWTFGTKSESNGYCTIAGHRVHIIVATAFFGERDSSKYVVDHIDTNRCNNRVSNLRWLTKLENVLLNPITRSKIERICGSVEKFLMNPSLLCNHEPEDNNFAWMRRVTREEAENTLKSWNDLINRPKSLQTSGKPIGEWIYGKKKFIAITPEEEEERKVMEEKRKEEKILKKEEERKRKAELRKEKSRLQNAKKKAIKTIANTIATSNNWIIGKNVSGNGWKADLTIQNNNKCIALKLFSSLKNLDEELEAMRLDGVMGYFLGQQSCESMDHLLPCFAVDPSDEQVSIKLSNHQSVSFDKFLYSIMDDRLCEKQYITVRKIRVRFLPYECYRCKGTHYVYTICGVFFKENTSTEMYEDIGVNVFEPIIIKAVKDYLKLHSELDYPMGEIKERYSKTAYKAYMSFGCPYCGGIVGEHFLQDVEAEAVYMEDDEFVHEIELAEPGLEIKCLHWAIE